MVGRASLGNMLAEPAEVAVAVRRMTTRERGTGAGAAIAIVWLCAWTCSFARAERPEYII
jgi:hypothetical protein